MTYKNYSLKQLENFLYDAMGAAEATPQEIYDVIKGVVENNYYTYKQQTANAYELLALLNGNGKGHIKAYDDCMRPWGHSDMEALQYTEEEMNAMCDAVEAKDKVKKWVLPVEETKVEETDEIEYFITFPDDLLEAANLKEGDQLEWVDNGDGSFLLKKLRRGIFNANSPEMVKLREELVQTHQESIDKSVGWYYNLSEEDKYRAVEALCHIICKAEGKGTSHRGLQHALGLYPQAFWIDGLMEIHNSLYTYYQEDESRAWETFPHEELDKGNQTPYNDEVPTEVQ